MKNNREEPTEHEVSFFSKGALFHIDFKVAGGVKTKQMRDGRAAHFCLGTECDVQKTQITKRFWMSMVRKSFQI